MGGTSRMNREVHVRICGRLGVKFLGLPGSDSEAQRRRREAGSEGSVEQRCGSMNKTADMRRERQTSGQLTAKSISIKGAKRKSDDGALKAIEASLGRSALGSGFGTEGAARQPDHRAEVSRGRSSEDSLRKQEGAKARTVPLPRGKGSGE